MKAAVVERRGQDPREVGRGGALGWGCGRGIEDRMWALEGWGWKEGEEGRTMEVGVG